MKLKDYMAEHDGEYTVAETTERITEKDLSAPWREMDVEPYLVGKEPGGRCKTHLYSVGVHVHVVTFIETIERPDQAPSEHGAHTPPLQSRWRQHSQPPPGPRF
jgi:hypothetical protein